MTVVRLLCLLCNETFEVVGPATPFYVTKLCFRCNSREVIPVAVGLETRVLSPPRDSGFPNMGHGILLGNCKNVNISNVSMNNLDEAILVKDSGLKLTDSEFRNTRVVMRVEGDSNLNVNRVIHKRPNIS